MNKCLLDKIVQNLFLFILLSLPFSFYGQLSISLEGTSPTCPGYSNGIVTTNTSGGEAPYLYSWNNGYSGPSIVGVLAGDYSVTVTDANNNTASASYTLEDPASIEITTTLDDICSGNGNVTTTVSGGVSPLTYMWNDGQTTANAVGLSPGIRCVTVTDANGCNGVSCLTVYQELSVTVLTSGLACFTSCDASVTAALTGGHGPFTYIWNTGATSSILENVPGGFYSVTVTDANGCTTSGNNTVTSPAELEINVEVEHPECGSGGLGTATVSADGGTGPYQFFWSNGQNGPVATNLTPGTYTVTAVDANGCADVEGLTVVEGGDIDLELVTTPTSECGSEDGSASVTASGGTPPYSYEWNNGATNTSIDNLAPGTYTITVTDSEGCAVIGAAEVGGSPAVTLTTMSIPIGCSEEDEGAAIVMAFDGTPPYSFLWNTGSTLQVIDNVPPGIYTVTVTDAADCTATAEVEVIADPGLDLTLTALSPSCDGGNNGSAVASVNNGTPPYSYTWSNGATSNEIDNLAPGVYTVEVTDSEGCTAGGEIEVEATPGIELTISKVDVNCFGFDNGILSVAVDGGTEPYTYAWSNGAVNAFNGSLSPGFYSVTVTDAEGCSATANAVIEQPNPVVISVIVNNSGCEGDNSGSASIIAEGGTPPYSYEWSNGATGTGINNLSPGDYSVTVEDANGCKAQTQFEILEFENPSCSIVVTSPISTVDGTDGAATVSVSGGTGPYDIQWSNGQSGPTADNLGAGDYSVIVTDANGCTTTCSISLSNPAKLGDRIWIDANRDGCQDDNEGGWYGLTVLLNGVDENGNNVIQTTTTDVLGNYLFDGLVPGSYLIIVEAPIGYVFTEQNACDDASDSDADPDTGYSDTVVLNAGDCNLTLDIGIYQKCVNVTDPGEICCDETLCAPGNDPEPITSVTPATGGLGNLEYIWMKSTTPGPITPGFWEIIPGATGESYDPGPIYETTYYARCARRECCVDFVETEIVTKYVDGAFAAVINGPDWVCEGDVHTYSTTVYGADVTYSWDFGFNATPSSSDQPSVDVVFDNLGVYTIHLTVSNDNCTSSSNMMVVVSGNPSLCGPGSSNLVANINNIGQVEVSWEMPSVNQDFRFVLEHSENEIDFEDLEVISPNSDGQYLYIDDSPSTGMNYYRLRLEDNYFNNLFTTMTQVEIYEENKEFQLFPNPFSEQLTVLIKQPGEFLTKVQVVTPYGEQVKELLIPSMSDGYTLDMSGLPGGLYYLHFRFDDNSERVYKVFKE